MSEELEHRLTELETSLLWMRENTKLQATEYERRLDTLNHAHEVALVKERDYVSQEKFDDYSASQSVALITQLSSEKEAREKALERVDERFEDFVTRYELHQREVDEQLAIQRGVAEESARTLEKATVRLGLVIAALGVFLTVVVLFANGTI